MLLTDFKNRRMFCICSTIFKIVYRFIRQQLWTESVLYFSERVTLDVVSFQFEKNMPTLRVENRGIFFSFTNFPLIRIRYKICCVIKRHIPQKTIE